MALLDRRGILKKETLRTEKVELGSDEFVFVRQMTGRERDRFEQSIIKEVKEEDGTVNYERSLEDFRAKLCVNTICDENGNNLLEPGDYVVLSKNMSAARLELIVNKSQELNKISEKDKKALVKNSEGDRSANSISNSVES